LDRAAFTAYCVSWSRWLEAETYLRKYGAIVKSPTGYAMMSPYLYVATGAMKAMHDFLSDFGMSPASRTRVDPDNEALSLPSPKPTGQAGRFFRDFRGDE